MDHISRRDAVRTAVGIAAGVAGASLAPEVLMGSPAVRRQQQGPRIRFGVIGINHGHIYGQCDSVIRGGGELVSFYAAEPELRAAFARRYPNARVATDERQVLEDNTLKLIISSIIPVQRAPLGIRVMQHGKDYMADKPGITTLEQLAEVRRVQAATGRIYSITYSERFENRSSVEAGNLVKAGAIGQVMQTIGLGPHKVTPASRPAWFWDPTQYGGIITDIGSHQMDQFLYYTGSTSGEVVASQVRNYAHQNHPEFQDFGDVMVKGNGGTGYIRLDWFTPETFPAFGDGRLTILGTTGFIECRKYADIGGRTGGSHLFLVDAGGTRYVDCSQTDLPYGRQVVDDVLNRTETAMPQAHCLLAMELVLRAQQMAQRA